MFQHGWNDCLIVLQVGVHDDDERRPRLPGTPR